MSAKQVALDICAIRASNVSVYSRHMVPLFEEMDISPGSPGAQLARQAWRAVYDALPKGKVKITEWLLWAEAGALLEEGWKPGNPVQYIELDSGVTTLLKKAFPASSVSATSQKHNTMLSWFPTKVRVSNGANGAH